MPLATIWGMEKFSLFFSMEKHLHAWGLIRSLLPPSTKKHMVDISPRIQRLVVRSFPYQPFWCPIQERKKDIPLADALSRVSPTPVEEDGIQLPIIAVNLITSSVSCEFQWNRDDSWERTARGHNAQSSEDTTYMWGWPVDRRMLPRELHTFWKLQRRSLHGKWTYYKRGPGLVIPSTLRSKVVGADTRRDTWALRNCMLKARGPQCFWPGIFQWYQGGLWRNVAFCQASSKSSKTDWKMLSDVPSSHMAHTRATDLFLLEQDWLPGDRRLLPQVPDHQKTYLTALHLQWSRS